MSSLETARRCAERMFAADKASQALGIQVSIPAAGCANAEMQIRDDMLNGFDVAHGGMTFALADTAFAFACNGHGEPSFAAAAQIEFLRPVHCGDTLTATATEDHRGRRSAYYTVAVRNQRDELVAIFRGRSSSVGSRLADDKNDT